MKRYLLILCFTLYVTVNAKPSQPIILVSLDGYRWDYPEKADTPNLDFLIENGVRAESLIPTFVTKTFPNHYSIVTGLYQENHGIIANNMVDPEIEDKFTLSNRGQVQNSAWWGGEPIWVTAEKQGIRTAPYFWPGSEVEINGGRPTHWQPYNHDMPYGDRIKQTLDCLKMPSAARPGFITLYFSLIDEVGHDFGPNSTEIVEAIEVMDSWLGELIDGLRETALLDSVNLIIVSDHGMIETSSNRLIFLDDYVELSKIQLVDFDPYAAINPGELSVDKIFKKLSGGHPHFKIYKKEDMPVRFHYSDHVRIPALLALPDDGWRITIRARRPVTSQEVLGGSHGYDNRLENMGAIFIAHGPAFKRGLKVQSFTNVHLYELMAHILSIQPAPNDGSLDSVKVMLNPEMLIE